VSSTLKSSFEATGCQCNVIGAGGKDKVVVGYPQPLGAVPQRSSLTHMSSSPSELILGTMGVLKGKNEQCARGSC